MAGIEPERVAEVIVETETGLGRRGSGYRVTTDTVLTAAHVVADATRVRVRFNADRPTEWSSTASVELESWAGDVAALKVTLSPSRASVAPVAYGKVGRQAATVTCIAVGFPRFKLRDDPGAQLAAGTSPSQYRDSHQIEGAISALSNWREGTLEVLVSPPERDPDPQHSPWEGMSSAAVWSSGRIVGLVSEHHRSDGLSRLAAVRTDRWYELLPPNELARLRAMTDLPAHVEGLVDVRPPGSPGASTAARWEADRRLSEQLRVEIRAAEADPSRLAEQLGIAKDGLRLHEKVLQYAPTEQLLFAFDRLRQVISDAARIRDVDVGPISDDLREILVETRGVRERPARNRLRACCHLGLYAAAVGKLDQGLSGTELLQVFAVDPDLGRALFPQFTAAFSGELVAEYDRRLRRIADKKKWRRTVEVVTAAARDTDAVDWVYFVATVGAVGAAQLAPLPPYLKSAVNSAIESKSGLFGLMGFDLLRQTVSKKIAASSSTLEESLQSMAKRDLDEQVQERMRYVAEEALGTKRRLRRHPPGYGDTQTVLEAGSISRSLKSRPERAWRAQIQPSTAVLITLTHEEHCLVPRAKTILPESLELDGEKIASSMRRAGLNGTHHFAMSDGSRQLNAQIELQRVNRRRRYEYKVLRLVVDGQEIAVTDEAA